MSGIWDLLTGLGSIGAGIGMASQASALGEQAASDMGVLSDQLQQDTAFKGYGVTTGLGTSTVDADGNTVLGVGPDETWQDISGGFMGNASQAATNAMADRAGREQAIYDSAMAMQQPGLDAQRAQTQAREQAMGRRGLMGSQFGGSGEDAAMARAQMQAQNQASFQAMGQAEQEMMNQANMANMFSGMGQNAYQTSFTPMQQQMAMLGMGGQNADRFQSGQFTGANLAAQLGIGGIQAQINAQKSAQDLYAQLFGAGLGAAGDALGGLFD